MCKTSLHEFLTIKEVEDLLSLQFHHQLRLPIKVSTVSITLRSTHETRATLAVSTDTCHANLHRLLQRLTPSRLWDLHRLPPLRTCLSPIIKSLKAPILFKTTIRHRPPLKSSSVVLEAVVEAVTIDKQTIEDRKWQQATLGVLPSRTDAFTRQIGSRILTPLSSSVLADNAKWNRQTI